MATKMLRILAIVVLALGLNACASLRNNLVKGSTQFTGDDFRVTLYSGGTAVRAWELKHGIVDEEPGSDGWDFACGTKLIRLSGDVVVEPSKEAPPLDISIARCF